MKIVKLLLFILFYSVLIGCFQKQKGQNTGDSDASVLRDSSYIFDGKTLTGWEITNFGPQGPVFISDDYVVLGMGDGCTGITWKGDFPVNDYEVSLEAKRVDGNDFFCGITFPVDKDPCTLIVGGWGGTVVGLSSINGMDASENETSTIRQFEKGRWYRFRLRVTEDTIQVWIDDEIVVDFVIGNNQLSIRPEVELSRPFGIASWRTTAAIRNIRVVGI
jgi:hypothetical protein